MDAYILTRTKEYMFTYGCKGRYYVAVEVDVTNLTAMHKVALELEPDPTARPEEVARVDGVREDVESSSAVDGGSTAWPVPPATTLRLLLLPCMTSELVEIPLSARKSFVVNTSRM